MLIIHMHSFYNNSNKRYAEETVDPDKKRFKTSKQYYIHHSFEEGVLINLVKRQRIRINNGAVQHFIVKFELEKFAQELLQLLEL